MSLPETIWCCQTHPHNGHECKGRCLSRRKKCPCELRVAGPDDLLIRREDIDYEAALQEWEFDVRRMFDTEGAYDDEGWLLARLTRCIDAALAAAEGGEG